MRVKILVKDGVTGMIVSKDFLCFDNCVLCGVPRRKRTSDCYIYGEHIQADAVMCPCTFLPHFEIVEEFKVIEMLKSLSIDTGINF